MDEMVACAPLSGQTYKSDRRLVHQYLMGFITGTPSEDYVKKTYVRGRCHNNGRMSFQALRLQYEGRGEMNRRLSEAAIIEKPFSIKVKKHYHSLSSVNKWRECLIYLRKKMVPNLKMKS